MSSLMHSYNRLPVSFSHGEGAWLWDEQGNKYLDALGGIAVNALGHAHPQITQALCEQSKRLIHTSNLYRIPAQETLAEKLCTIAEMDRVFFCNSGAEANEAAIKIARLHAHKQQIDNPAIVVMDGSFHGRTLTTLSATGNINIQTGFAPLVQGFIRTPYNDIEAIEHIAQNSRNVVAVMVEPILGEGGIIIADTGYLKKIRALCDANNWLMILDEIQTGIGRTGKWFAWQHEEARPDIVTCAKALGNGVPIGACLAQGEAADLITPGSHGTTFGGNPLACAVANSVLLTIEQNNYVERAATLGHRIIQQLKTHLAEQKGVKNIRGKGLMIAVELDRNCSELMQAGLDAGILINVTAGNTIRLLPPYILDDDEADLLAERVAKLCQTFLSEQT